MKAKCLDNSGMPYLEIGRVYDVEQDTLASANWIVNLPRGSALYECCVALKSRFDLVPEVKPGNVLPTDATARKNIPIVRGCLDYFPAALAAVAELSRIGNEQHNPGQPMHHAREKSTDHADCIVRHTMQRGTVDTDGVRHATKAAWRALALLQEELEAAGAPLARGAKLPKP